MTAHHCKMLAGTDQFKIMITCTCVNHQLVLKSVSLLKDTMHKVNGPRTWKMSLGNIPANLGVAVLLVTMHMPSN